MSIFINRRDKQKIKLSDEYKKILKDLNAKMTLEEMGKQRSISRQAMHTRIVSLVNTLYEKEPFLKEFIDGFNTYVNLEQFITPQYRGIVSKALLLKNKTTFQSPIDKKFIVDKKFRHENKKILGQKRVISGEFIKDIEKVMPISIKESALIFGADEVIYAQMLKEVFSLKFFVIDDYIISSTKYSVFNAIKSYCADKNINYSGTTKEAYFVFKEAYPEAFASFVIETQTDFLRLME